VARALLEREGAIQVRTGDELAATLESLFDNASQRERLGAAAFAFVTENRGAVQRLLALIESHAG
jgi:3-deoxy-D-manno-octulosonic-acid transferase